MARPRSIKKIIEAAYQVGRAQGLVMVGVGLTKKEMIRYLENCQRAEMDTDAVVLEYIEQSGYLAESKHLTKLYKQTQNNGK